MGAVRRVNIPLDDMVNSNPLLHPTRSFTLMGVLNVTPDSFSDGGRYADPGQAIERGLELRALGADWVDVGGESTRPGSEPVGAEEELRRILPVVQSLAAQGVPVSIDTYRTIVAEAAVGAGAGMVNDISAFSDPAMAPLVARAGVAALLMHMQGSPKDMQKSPQYSDVVLEVRAFLAERLEAAERHGVPRARMGVDPGIGFGKSIEHNLTLLGRLRELTDLGVPVAVGVSRKSFLGILTGNPDPGSRLAASLSAAVCAYLEGARFFRVHDLKETRDALMAAEAVKSHDPRSPD